MKTIRRLFETRKQVRNYRTVENLIRDVLRGRIFEQRDKIEKDQSDQIVAGTYKTKNFEMCRDAQKLFVSLPKGTNPNDAELAAIEHDKLFALEKQVIAKERSTEDDIKEANFIVEKIKKYGKAMKVLNRMGYLEDHLKTIESHLQKDQETYDNPSPEMMKKRFTSPPMSRTKEPDDRDIDNSKFLVSRNIKAQRKLKIIDAD